MAKKKSKTPEAPAPKKSLATTKRRRRARKATRVPSAPRTNPRANPPMAQDITHVLLPGFAAYAATRVLQRIVWSLVSNRWPGVAKYAHAATGAAAFGATWFFAHRVDKLAPYHDGIVMGSGVAALQGVATAFLPVKYSWLLADCNPDDLTPTQSDADTAAQAAAAAQQQAPAPQAGDEYSYLEDQLDGIQRQQSRGRGRMITPPKTGGRQVASAMQQATTAQDQGATLDPDLLAELDSNEDVDSFYTGAFSN